MKLTFEATNICPLPCHDNDQNRPTREKGVLNPSTFKAIVEKCARLGISELEFGGAGEALLNPNIIDLIAHTKLISPRTRTTLVTNGLFLTAKIALDINRAGLNNIVIILSPSHLPLTTSLRGSEKGRIYENITLASKIFKEIKIVHALPQWSYEQREIISTFWNIRGIKKIFFSSRLACGSVIKQFEKTSGQRPPACALFKAENYITWDGKLISCCHDNSSETAIGQLDIESPEPLFEKKKIIIERQFFYPICYECFDDRRHSTKGIIQKVISQVINSLSS